MNELGIGALKLAALGSYCGGPLLISDQLKPHFGSPGAFLLTFAPVGLMLFGSFFLEDELGDRFSRAMVWLGRQSLYLVLAMHAYAVWCFTHGIHIAEPYLYYTGMGIGIVWAIYYLRAARRWSAPLSRDSVDYRQGPPIAPM